MLAQSADDVLSYLASSFSAPGQILETELETEAADLSAPAENASIKGAEPAPPISRRLPTSPSGTRQKSQVAALTGPRPDFSDDENKIWLALDVEPRHLDDVAEQAGLEMRVANSAIVMLEIKGVVKKLPGNLFVKIV